MTNLLTVDVYAHSRTQPLQDIQAHQTSAVVTRDTSRADLCSISVYCLCIWPVNMWPSLHCLTHQDYQLEGKASYPSTSNEKPWCTICCLSLRERERERALQAHMADLNAARELSAEDAGDIPRLKSRDSTKELGQVIKEIGAAPKYYGLFNGSVSTAVTGMPTKAYREVQVNLKPREAAREAFTDSMLGMTGTINAQVRDNLAEGSSADEQLEFRHDKCTQAAELLGLHKKARQVQPREHIAGNKRLMSLDLGANRRLALGQQQVSRMSCSVYPCNPAC